MAWWHVGNGSSPSRAKPGRGRIRRGAAVILTTLLLVTACTGTDSTGDSAAETARCRGLAVETIDGMQRFVDEFADVGLEDLTGDEIPGLQDLEENVKAARDRAVRTECDPEQFDAMLAEETKRLEGTGPVGRRLAAALRGDVPARERAPEDLTVDPSADLAAILAEAGSGSVITLEAGGYDLSELIVVDRSLTLVGAGADRTILRSSSSSAAILVRVDGSLNISEIAIEHVGDEPASVVVVSDGDLSMLAVRVAGGIQDLESGRDGHGLALFFAAPEDQEETETVGVVDVARSEFAANEQTGIAVVGEVAPRIADSEAIGNGLCGICYFDTAAGIAENNSIEGNEVGMGVSDSAHPTLTGNVVRDNSVSGFLVEGEASPWILDSLIEGNGRVGLSVSGTSSVRIEHNEIVDHPQGIALAGNVDGTVQRNVFDGNDVGVLVTDDATPSLEENEINNSATGAIIYGDRAAGTARANSLTEHAIGIQAGDDSAPRIEDNEIDSVDGIGLLFLDRSAGVAIGNAITNHATGIQARGFASPRIEGGSVWGASATGIVFAERAAGSVSGVAIRGTEIGILVGGNAGPAVEENTIEGTAAAGIVFGGQSTGVASENRVVDSGSVGIQVGMTSTPDLDENILENSRDVGLLYIDDAAGTAAGNLISGGEFGIQVSDQAAPTIDGNTLTDVVRGSMLFAEDTGGTVSGNSCDRGAPIVLMLGAAPTVGENDCVVRRRSS
ncbi:MAG: right-handed parallel beta-helix repeat-containing protein [Actinomycetota bacterium]|nr:right-handed parallel beta-helix repeat-containing protein [Actinomycetota bacterium]